MYWRSFDIVFYIRRIGVFLVCICVVLYRNNLVCHPRATAHPALSCCLYCCLPTPPSSPCHSSCVTAVPLLLPSVHHHPPCVLVLLALMPSTRHSRLCAAVLPALLHATYLSSFIQLARTNAWNVAWGLSTTTLSLFKS